MSIIRRRLSWANFVLLICFTCGSCYPQATDTSSQVNSTPSNDFLDSMMVKYPFLNVDTNRIENDSALIACFFERLDEVKDTSKQKVVNI